MVKANEIPKAIKDPKNAVKVGHSRLDSYMSQLVFKNSAGFANNLHGKRSRAKIKKIQKQFKISPKNIPAVEEFRKNGHALLGIIHDKQLIDEVSSKFKKVIDDEDLSFVRSQHDGQVFSRQIRLVHKNIPEVKKLITAQVIEFFEQYYKTPFKIVDIFAWRNIHVPPEIANKHEMFSSYWHCDGRDTTWTKLFVYLDDVTSKDGPFHVQTSDRTKEIFELGFVDRKKPNIPKELLENPKYITTYTGVKGTTLVGNLELTLHKAGIPELGHTRDLIQFQLAPSDMPLKENWEEDLESVKDYNDRIIPSDLAKKSIT
ncbi:MAG: hypothetical protein CXT78_00935 [Thaumarchaeota archaeon]|jgi:hypothetical protein|nr:MAG: hypothetical protein CXT78_00935 [Nitrososphaerota archaeon]